MISHHYMLQLMFYIPPPVLPEGNVANISNKRITEGKAKITKIPVKNRQADRYGTAVVTVQVTLLSLNITAFALQSAFNLQRASDLAVKL